MIGGKAGLRLITSVLVWGAVAFASPGASAGPGSEKGVTFTPEKIREILDALQESIVIVDYSIEFYEPSRQRNVKRDLYCLGLVVDESGLVMVRGHVSVRDVKPFNVRVRLRSGTQYDATVLEKDRRINVAFLKLIPEETSESGEFGLSAVSFAQDPSLEVGDEIMVLGVLPETLDFERSFRVGHVASAIETPRRVFTADFPVPYGMIGGPVVNADGEVVGVVGYDLDRREGGEIYVRSGYPLIYTADLFQRLIDKPPTEEKVEEEEAWLGIFTQPLTDGLAEYWGLERTGGIVVSTVIANSPAERAGLLRGDVIKVFDGAPIETKDDTEVIDFTRVVRETGTGKPVPVTIIREGSEMRLDIELAQTPKSVAEAEKYEDEDFGLTVREITEDLIIVANLDPGMEGIVVDRVEGAGWASLAGLLPGDIIRQIDGKQVITIEGFQEILNELKERKPKEIVVFVERARRTGFLRIEPDWQE